MHSSRGRRSTSRNLEGATLDDASLQGASLSQAQLQGASLNRAQLQGALLEGTQLRAASIVDAELQGTLLTGAHLQGASLDGAEFQGGSFNGAQLDFASLQETFAWRTKLPALSGNTHLRAEGLTAAARRRCGRAERGPCSWSLDEFNKLHLLIEEKVPDRSRRVTLERIDPRLNPAEPSLSSDEQIAREWQYIAHSEVPDQIYEQGLADVWRETGRGAVGAPYVVTALAIRLSSSSAPFSADSKQIFTLAAAFLHDGCVGARGISEDTRSQLTALVGPANAPSVPSAAAR